jgi:hypothetical protein
MKTCALVRSQPNFGRTILWGHGYQWNIDYMGEWMAGVLEVGI